MLNDKNQSKHLSHMIHYCFYQLYILCIPINCPQYYMYRIDSEIFNRIILFNMDDLFLENYIKSQKIMKKGLNCVKQTLNDSQKRIPQNSKLIQSRVAAAQRINKTKQYQRKTCQFQDMGQDNQNRELSLNFYMQKNEDDISDFEDEGLQDDSIYEFSEEIMLANPKKESRQQRQSNKLKHLYIYDWMMMTAMRLKLTKQILYRAILIAKKFFFLEQKTQKPQVNLTNVNCYGLGALLISSKFENVHGNFLSNKVWIGDEKAGLSKKNILECESYMLRILAYKVCHKSFIIQACLEVIQRWQAVVTDTDLQILNITNQPINHHILNSQIQQSSFEIPQVNLAFPKLKLLETFIYLIDYVVLRKMVELKIKDLCQLQKIETYKICITNVLYHLMCHLIRQEILAPKNKLPKFKRFFIELVKRLNLNSAQSNQCLRKSHLLSKQIRQIFANRYQKSQKIQNISIKNQKISEYACKCNLNSMRVLQKEQETYQQNKVNHAILPPNQLTIETASTKQEQNNQLALIDFGEQHEFQLRSQICCKKTPCIRHTGQHDRLILQKLLNRQFYLPVIAPTNSKCG